MLDKDLYNLAKPHFTFSAESIFKSKQQGRGGALESKVIDRHYKDLVKLSELAGSEIEDFYAARAKEKLVEIDLANAVIDKDHKNFLSCQINLFGGFKSRLVAIAAANIKEFFKGLDADTGDEKYVLETLDSLGYGIGAVQNVKKVDLGNLVPAFEVAKSFEVIINNSFPKWRVVIASDRNHIAVKPHTRQIFVPAEKLYRQQKLKALIAHELTVHVTRAENGHNSNLGLLSLGFNNYKVAEEGLAKIQESIYLPETMFDSWKWYLISFVAYKEMLGDENFDVKKFLRGLIAMRKKIDKPKINPDKTFNSHYAILTRGGFSGDVYWLGNKKYLDGVELVENFILENNLDSDNLPEILWAGRYDFTDQQQLDFVGGLKG